MITPKIKLKRQTIIFPSGVSIESASYMENNNLVENMNLIDHFLKN